MDEKQELNIVKLNEDAQGRARYGAMLDGQQVGSVLMNWAPKYRPFAVQGLAEVQELFVEAEYRQRGIGRAMVEYCEDLARDQGHTQIGIGVGLTGDYGAAQRLYARMGYIPDGQGVTYDRETVAKGDVRPMDDDMSLMLLKTLENI